MNPREIFNHVFSNEIKIAAGVFGLICLVMLTAFALSHRRKRAGRPPSRRDKNNPVEIGLAAAIAVVAAYIITLSFQTNGQETAAQAAPPGGARNVVDVTGFQWCWNFAYPGHKVSVTNSCAHFTHRPTMVIPVGQPVTLRITSVDVIHSWWVPALRYKMDAFPNHINTITITVDHAGRWVGRCAELCGIRHYEMDFWLKAVPADQYQKWLASGGAAR